ncbi:MAG: TRAP transporter substrate-binding protein [Victivallales bacterium]|nr:TRAP transporter substrate-binding protein [Victivallales bacterium]
MKDLRGLMLYAFLALACVFLASCGNGLQDDAKPEFRMTYNVFFPSSHAAAKLANEWADEVFKRTNGRLKVDVYAGSVLSNDSENFNCVVFGAADIGMSCFAYSRGLFPLIECLDLPHGYRTGTQATKIANDFIRHFKPKELNDVELMYVHAHGPGVLACHKDVENIDDVRKMRLRGTGVTAMAIRAMGADAVGLSQGETYEALRKGVVQGTLCPIETLNGWKQGEVIDNVVKIPALGYTTSMFVVMNRDSWAQLPKDIQDIIRQINEEWIGKHGQRWDEMDAEGEAYVRSLGKKVSEISADANDAFVQAMSKVMDQWKERAKLKGLPAEEALDFIQREIKEQE